jgi:ribose 1,5-bisphosphokinase PhnN
MSLIGGFPVILSAPSGGGKTTIAKALLARRPDLGYSVSCTTRSARPGEVEGKDYYFISRAEFITEREQGAFAESAVVHGNLYGTLRREVERVLAGGRHGDGHRCAGRRAVHACVSAVRDHLHHAPSGGSARPASCAMTESPAQLAARLQSAPGAAAGRRVRVRGRERRARTSRLSVESIVDAEVVSRERGRI